MQNILVFFIIFGFDIVTPSKHIRHARVMGLYLKVATSAIGGFKIRKYNTWPLKFHTSLLNTNLQSQVFIKYTFINKKYKLVTSLV